MRSCNADRELCVFSLSSHWSNWIIFRQFFVRDNLPVLLYSLSVCKLILLCTVRFVCLKYTREQQQQKRVYTAYKHFVCVPQRKCADWVKNNKKWCSQAKRNPYNLLFHLAVCCFCFSNIDWKRLSTSTNEIQFHV